MKVAIFGTGAYGFGVASTIYNNCHNIMMWTPFEKEKTEIERTRVVRSLPDYVVPEDIKITNSLTEVMTGSNLLIVAVPVAGLDNLFSSISNMITNTTHICITSKGISEGSNLYVHQILEKYINTENFAIISGPSFAIDLVNKGTCGLTLASKSSETIEMIKEVFNVGYIKIVTTDDIIGTEICGSVKNVIAMASGMLEGLKASESTRAMLLTDALNAISNIVIGFGGKQDTVLNYAGIGDLLLTCCSFKSRNYQFGILLGKNESQDKIEEYLKSNTVEGYNTLISIYQLLSLTNIDIPIIDLLYNIVKGEVRPDALLSFLVQS